MEEEEIEDWWIELNQIFKNATLMLAEALLLVDTWYSL